MLQAADLSMIWPREVCCIATWDTAMLDDTNNSFDGRRLPVPGHPVGNHVRPGIGGARNMFDAVRERTEVERPAGNLEHLMSAQRGLQSDKIE